MVLCNFHEIRVLVNLFYNFSSINNEIIIFSINVSVNGYTVQVFAYLPQYKPTSLQEHIYPPLLVYGVCFSRPYLDLAAFIFRNIIIYFQNLLIKHVSDELHQSKLWLDTFWSIHFIDTFYTYSLFVPYFKMGSGKLSK